MTDPKAIWYSRCINCGEWVTDYITFDDGQVECLDCLHGRIDEQIEEFSSDPAHVGIPTDDLFK